MKLEMDLPERSLDCWDKDDAITVEITEGGHVRVNANKAGLYSLARLLLLLAQDSFPTPYFVGLRESVTPDSVGVSVRKVADEDGVMSRREIRKQASTEQRKRVEDYRELIDGYLAGTTSARDFKRNCFSLMPRKVEPQVNEEPFASIVSAMFATVRQFDPMNLADEAYFHRINEQELRAEMERLLARLDEAIAAEAHKDNDD